MRSRPPLPLQPCLAGLALPEPSVEALELVGALGPPALEALLCHADQARVLLPAARALIGRYGSEIVPANLRPRLERHQALRDELFGAMCGCAALAQSQGLTIVFVKGFAVESLYGEGYQRQFDDLDPAVPDLATFWKVLALVQIAGFDLLHLALRQDPETGRIDGAAAVSSPSQADPEDECRFDFQIAAQPLLWSTTAPFGPGFWQECEPVARVPVVRIPSLWQSAAILLGEALEQGRLRSRDLTDFAVLVGALREDAVLDLQRQIELSGLAHQLARFRRAFEENRFLRAFLAERPFVLLFGGKEPRRVRLRSAMLSGRFGSAMAHAYDLTQQRGGGIRACLWGTAGAALCEAAADRSRLALLVAQCVEARRLMEAGLFVRFIYLGAEPCGDLAWSGGGGEARLITPVGTFLAVPWGAVSQRHVAAIRRWRVAARLETAA